MKGRSRLRRSLSRGVTVGSMATFGVFSLAAACSSKANPVGPGGECFLATDCAPGLVCLEQPNKTRVCSDDLTRVVGKAPPKGDADDAGAEGGNDGAPPDAAPVQDAGKDDTGVQDTGTLVEDAAGDT